jgi:hypothetical protein
MTDQQPTIEQQAQGIALRKAILRLTETAEYLGHRVEALEAAQRPANATQAAERQRLFEMQQRGLDGGMTLKEALRTAGIYPLSVETTYGTDTAIPQLVPTPARSLVKRVSAAVNRTHIGEIDGIARAAIRVMAGELRAQCFVHAADWLDAQSDQ